MNENKEYIYNNSIFSFFFSKESKSEYMYARIHITERLTLKITILYLCVIHEREKVNNVIKTFLCFVINFTNVYLLYLLTKECEKLDSKISNLLFVSWISFSRNRNRKRECIECGIESLETPCSKGIRSVCGGGRNEDKENKGERMAGK